MTNETNNEPLSMTDVQIFALAPFIDGPGGQEMHTNLRSAVRSAGAKSREVRDSLVIRVFNTQTCPGRTRYVDFIDEEALLKLDRLCDQDLWDLEAELRAGRTISALIDGEPETKDNPLRGLFAKA